jgi:hypothetical protein
VVVTARRFVTVRPSGSHLLEPYPQLTGNEGQDSGVKGTWAETEVRKYLEQQQWEWLGGNRQRGIDGVFRRLIADGHTYEYLIVEMKHGKTPRKSGQMRQDWIETNLPNAVSSEQTRVIRRLGYQRWVMRAYSDGLIEQQELPQIYPGGTTLPPRSP